IARSIEIRAKADWLLAIAFWWDVCPSAALSDEFSDPIGVKSTISEQHCSRFQAGQQREDKAVVMRLASGQCDTNRQPTGIDDSVNLGRQSASRPAHQLFTVRSNAFSMLMHAHDGCINHLHGRIIARGQRIHKLIPHASPAPSNKAIVGALTSSPRSGC